MVFIANYHQFNICKDIVIAFCQQFKKLPVNDRVFLQMQKEFLSKNPQINSYTYNFLFEAVYHKKLFLEEDISQAFDQTFAVEDLYQVNNGMAYASTINTAFTLNHLDRWFPQTKIPRIVFSTPLNYENNPVYEAAKLIPSVQEHRELSLKSTGQVNCDCSIGGRLYDIKNTTHMGTKLNHIYPMDFETAEVKLQSHLTGVLKHIKSQKYSKIRNYLAEKLESLLQEKSINFLQKNDIWNHIIAEQMDRIPKEICFGIGVPTSQRAYDFKYSKKEREFVHVSPDTTEKPEAARMSVSGVLCRWSKPTYKKNASIMTENGLELNVKTDCYEVD